VRHAIRNSEDTLQDYELAAEERYWDACELLVNGRAWGGLYLLGYTVEMLLKAACFRVDRLRPNDPVSLGTIRPWHKKYFPTVDLDGFHSLRFWCLLLRRKRRMRGVAFASEFDDTLVRRTRRLHSAWCVEMRYRSGVLSPALVSDLLDDASWVRLHRAQLWR
jgi:hypothetical protein